MVEYWGGMVGAVGASSHQRGAKPNVIPASTLNRQCWTLADIVTQLQRQLDSADQMME